MGPQIVWRRFKAFSVTGRKFLGHPKLPYDSGALLLRQILEMPQTGEKIDYDAACMLFLLAFNEYVLTPGTTPESAENFHNSFVEWVSEQGYYIELTGDEYMPLASVQ